MRWWINTDHGLMSVDNSSTKGIDVSSLLPDNIWMVQWIDGKGEIELQDEAGNNLNGLRETFTYLTPWCPFFPQFMHLLPGLTLAQAQKIQTDLIQELYDSKRQLPLHHAVAAGDYTWPADDGAVANMSTKTMPSVLAGLGPGSSGGNDLISQINTIINLINANIVTHANTLVTQVNAQEAAIITRVNSGVVEPVNAGVVASGNSLIVDHNDKVVAINNLAGAANVLVSFLNDTVLGDIAVDANTVNNKLQTSAGNAAPGLSGGIAHTAVAFGGATTLVLAFAALSALAALTPISNTFVPVDNISTPLSSKVGWTPIESATPVDLTLAEISAIMSGIASRREDLLTVKTSKSNAIMALTDIDDVIDYDVTAGWP